MAPPASSAVHQRGLRGLRTGFSRVAFQARRPAHCILKPVAAHPSSLGVSSVVETHFGKGTSPSAARPWDSAAEEARFHIEASWLSGGDRQWLWRLLGERRQALADAVRSRLAPLLPQGQVFSLGQLLLLSKEALLETVRLLLAYEYGMEPDHVKPHMRVTDLSYDDDAYDRFREVVGRCLPLGRPPAEGELEADVVTIQDMSEWLYDRLSAEREYWGEW
ncbi:hypothetical protein HYH03_001329 [Edaphochlamys debaryana]|uniref:Uncharacterized protein n=1 Tax=Edaphochlamys debaryana TaxID=47281 RepID=A0A835YG27_9CHLO|nr:hypothetical protein HYH03_001329 [Edaphochlamys debaryana]|eukprot:KAG2500558.1 hypothetical protein HYH03_001329 [Edaphochlamys debaryana]